MRQILCRYIAYIEIAVVYAPLDEIRTYHRIFFRCINFITRGNIHYQRIEVGPLRICDDHRFNVAFCAQTRGIAQGNSHLITPAFAHLKRGNACIGIRRQCLTEYFHIIEINPLLDTRSPLHRFHATLTVTISLVLMIS